MEEINSLILLDSASEIKVLKTGKALPAVQKKEEVHAPEVKDGFIRLFKDFYGINNANEVDPKTRKKIVEKETFTRYLQLPKQEKTAIFTTREIYFIPLEFKFGRLFYKDAYVQGEKKAPDCQSSNGVVPQTNKFAISCDTCDYSKWMNTTPPRCGELPEILAIDMTSKTIKDPELASRVTAEAVTIQFGKSGIKAVKDLMKQLAEPQAFDDGTYGQIDMTQFLVKATLSVALDENGKELTYCLPIFEIIGQVPFETSEKLLEMLNTPLPIHGNKTVRELFIGRTDPFTEVSAEKIEEKSAQPEKVAAPPKAAPRDKAVSVKKEEPLAEAVTITMTVTGEDEDDAVSFEPAQPEEKVVPATPTVKASPKAITEDDLDEVVF